MPSRSDRSHQVAERLRNAEVASDQRLQVQTLGAHRFVIGETSIEASSGTVFQLLLRLVYSSGMAVPRSNLLTELWPDLPDERRGANLRQSLYKLRTMGVDVVQLREMVQLSRVQVARTFPVERTVEAFERDVIHGKEPFGPMLPGWRAGSAELEEWLAETRELVHAEIREVLVTLLRARRERADWSGAQVLARWLLQFDPLHEDATLTVAECAMLAGAKAEAVAILDRYLAELGPDAGDIRLPATQLRKRFVEPPRARRKSTLANAEQHFVGREEEMAALTMAMRRARWHDGSAVLLYGPPGIGKTRMVQELCKVAQIEGYREILIECRETDQERPLAGLMEILPELLDAPGALGCAPDSLALLKQLGMAVNTQELTEKSVTSNSSNRSFRSAFIDLLGSIADEKPIFLAVEDCHWQDRESWQVFYDLMLRLDALRIYIVFTSRNRELFSPVQERLHNTLHFLDLPALSPSAVKQLTHEIASDLSAVIDRSTEAWLANGCEGNPLLLHALINHWAETGASEGLPPSLSALISQRLLLLDPKSIRCLQTVCLLDKLATVQRIQAALELPTYDLLHSIEQLEAAGCLSKSEALLVVSHDLVKQATISNISLLIKGSLHFAIAKSLEQESLESAQAALLLDALYHYSRASRFDDAERILKQHSAKLIELGNPRSIADAIDNCLSQANRDKLSESTLSFRARLHLEAGNYADSLNKSTRTVAFPETVEEMSDSAIDSLLSKADSAHRADPVIDRSELTAFTLTVCSSATAAEELKLRAVEIGLTICANTCDSKTAQELYELTHFERDSSKNRDQVTRIELLFHTIFGDLAKAGGVATRLIFDRLKAERSTVVVQDIGRGGYTLRLLGEASGAKTCFESAFEMARELDVPSLAQYPAWQLSQMAIDVGDYLEAEKWNRALVKLVGQDEDATTIGFINAHLCRFAIMLGDRDDASHHLASLRNSLPRFPTVKASAYTLALELATGLLATNWIPDEALLSAALEKHRRSCSFATCDFLTGALVRSLKRTEKRHELEGLLSLYQSERRENAPFSKYLADALSSN